MRVHLIRVRRRRFTPLVVVSALVVALVAPVIVASPASAAPGDITTVVGGGNPPGGLGDGLLATQATLILPWGVEEAPGEVFVSEHRSTPLGAPVDRVRRVDASGVISTFAGAGAVPRDGGTATDATLSGPEGVAFDALGNMFVFDPRGQRVRKVDAGGDGVVNGDPGEFITTVAGTGTLGFSGDGGPATAAQLNTPIRGAVDSAGALLISDASNRRVRRVTTGADGAVNGGADEIITTVAGTGTGGAGGLGGPATSAQFDPRGLAFDTAGNLYIASVGSSGIRKVIPGADGLVDGDPDDLITSFAVPPGFPEGLAYRPGAGLYASMVGTPRVYLLDGAGTAVPVAGNGVQGTGVTGDGGPALEAGMSFAYGVTFDDDGNVYIADSSGNRVRRVTPGPDGVVNGGAGEIITTVAGTGFVDGPNLEGVPALSTRLRRPADVAARAGNLFIAEADGLRIRRVDPAGIITTVAGGGVGDGLLATSAALDNPRGVSAGTSHVYIADCGNHRVRAVDRGTGIISTLAVGPTATSCPSGVHLTESGPAPGVYVADAGSHQVYRVDPSSGVSTVVAGTGTPFYGGDAGLALNAGLSAPAGVFVDGVGNVYIADTGNNRIRKVDAATGTIATVAGNGLFALGGDGVPATSGSTAGPTDVVVDAVGGMAIADAFNRVREVTPGGTIATIAGVGFSGFTGDNGPARHAQLFQPTQVDFDAAGNLFLTDKNNHRVRRIEAGTPPPDPPPGACGQVITTNTVLTGDVGPCSGDGIVLGADNITLDLNGHRVLGDAQRDDGVGIRLSDRTGVTVTGGGRRGAARGSVSGFDAGVAIIGGSRNKITHMTVEDNVGPTDGNGVFGDGIGVFFSPGNQITNNLVRRNGVYDGIGILGIGSDNNIVMGNTVEANTEQGARGLGGIGIVLNAYLDDSLPRQIALAGNRLHFNVVRDNEVSGISSIGIVRSVVSDNTVASNGLATGFPGNGIAIQPLLLAGGEGLNLVLRNQVHGNARNGLEITSRQNQIVNNDASHNNVRSGSISSRGYDLRDMNNDCGGNTWSGNIWGSGGFNPSCTTVGGHPASGTVAAAEESDAPATHMSATTDESALSTSPTPRLRPPMRR